MTVMLYKHPGPHEIHGGNYDYIIVDEDGVKSALDEGWSMTTEEALSSSGATASHDGHADDAPPTREEMELKAAELGIHVDGRWGDAKLLAKIEEAINAA